MNSSFKLFIFLLAGCVVCMTAYAFSQELKKKEGSQRKAADSKSVEQKEPESVTKEKPQKSDEQPGQVRGHKSAEQQQTPKESGTASSQRDSFIDRDGDGIQDGQEYRFRDRQRDKRGSHKENSSNSPTGQRQFRNRFGKGSGS